MHLVQLVDFYAGAGGRERFIHDFSRRLRKRGHRTTLACFESGNPGQWGAELGPELQRLDPRRPREAEAAIRALRPDGVLWHVSAATAPLARQLLKSGPVWAVVHDPITCPANSRLFRDNDQQCERPAGPACVVNWRLRSCRVHFSLGPSLKTLAETPGIIATLRRCPVIYTPSQAMRRTLAIDGVGPVRVYDPTLGRAAAIAAVPLAPPGPGPLSLLYAGRLVYEKGVTYLLDALAWLAAEGREARLTVVGEGYFRPWLEARLAALGLGERVRFAGHARGEEMAGWYQAADMLVVPSIWVEAAGLVVPEARSHGKPVVVTDAGGLPEWAGYFSGVHIARRADAQDLARAIGECASGVPAPRADGIAPSLDLLDDLESLLKTGRS